MTTRNTPPAATPPDDLPQYDDEPQVDADRLQRWLVANLPTRWGERSVPDVGDAHSLQPEQRAMLAEYERQIVVDVVGALLTVGDATIVKNPTYRALVRDQRQLEQLAAALTRYGFNDHVVQHDGNVVAAAVDLLAYLAAVHRSHADG